MSDQNLTQQNVVVSFEGEDNLSRVVDNISEKVNNLWSKVGYTNLALSAFGKSFKEGNESIAQFAETVAKLDESLTSTVTVLAIAKAGATIADGFNKATAEFTGFTNGVKAFVAAGFNRDLVDSFAALSSAILGDQNALESFSLQALTAFNRYSKAQTEVAVLFNQGDPFVKNLSGQIQGLVNGELQNSVTSIDALRASYQAASALFLSTGENSQVMAAGLKLAKAGGADTSATMKVLTQTLRAYNMEASDSNKVAAVLNKTVQLGITTMPELSNGFASVAVTAKAAGVKLEDMASALAALTLKGTDTPSAMTGLDALFRTIISKTPEAVEALSELTDKDGNRIRFDIAEVRTKGLTKAVQDLYRAANGNPTVIRQIIGESTAFNAFLTLAANNAHQLESNSKQMHELVKTGEAARHALDEVFGIKLNTQGEKFEQIVNRITESFIQFGELLAPFFDKGIGVFEHFVSALTSMPPWLKETAANMLIFQLSMQQVTNGIGVLVGTVFKLVGIFASWRIMTLLFSGELLNQVNVVTGLIKINAGWMTVLKQIIGLDQSRLLVEKTGIATTLSRTEILKKLFKGEGDRFELLKQLIGLDKEYITGEQSGLTILEQRQKALDLIVNRDSLVLKAEKELNAARQEQSMLMSELQDKYKIQNGLKAEEIAINESLTKAEIELAEANAVGNQANIKTLEQEVQSLRNKQIFNKRSQLDLEPDVSKLENKIEKSNFDVHAQQTHLNETKSEAADRYSSVIERNIQIQTLEAEAVQKTTEADNLRTEALILRQRATTETTIATKLLAEADEKEAIAIGLSTEAQTLNNRATELSSAAKTEAAAAATAQAIAEGRLIEVNTLLGKQLVANNALTRLLFKDLTLPTFNWSGILDGLKNFGATAAALFANLGRMILPLFEGIGVAIEGIVASLGLWLAPLIAVVALGAIIYDQFFGTSAQIRKMNESLAEINKQQKEQIDSLKTLDEYHDVRSKMLEKEKTDIQYIHGSWDSVGNAIDSLGKKIGSVFGTSKKLISDTFAVTGIDKFGDILKSLFNSSYLDSIIKPLKDGLNGIFNGSWMKIIQYDQYADTFNEINRTLDKTEDKINTIHSLNSKMKQGLSGNDDIDKLFKSGNSIDIDTAQKIKTQYEFDNKVIDTQISTNQKRLDVLNDRLKNFDASKASDADKQLADERDNLQASTKELSDQLDQRKQMTDNFFNNYIQNYNVAIKRVNENNLNPNDVQTNTLRSDMEGSVNAIQTRLKKMYRTSNDDLQDFAKQFVATIDGTGTYLDKNGKKQKIDITKMADYVQTFDRNVQTSVSSIDDLYKGNYIKADDAKSKILNLLDGIVTGVDGKAHKMASLLDPNTMIDLVNKAIEYSGQGVNLIIEKKQNMIDINKAMEESMLQSTIATNKKIRQLQIDEIAAQVSYAENQYKTMQGRASTEQLEAQMRKINLLRAQLNAEEVQDRIKTIDELAEREIKRIQNTSEFRQLGFKKEEDAIAHESDLLDEQIKLIESRNKLMNASVEAQIAGYQNQLRLTADIEDRAELQLKITKDQAALKEQQAVQELKTFELQQRGIELGLERKQIELDIAVIKNRADAAELAQQLIEAKQEKFKPEELKAVQLKIAANKEESKVLGLSSELLQKQKQDQIELTNNARQELIVKQNITREGNKIDIELAQRNRILAVIEKQADIAKVNAQIAEENGNKQITQIEFINKLFQERTDLITKQKELNDTQNSAMQNLYKIGQDLALTDYQKRIFARDAAKQELLALQKRQEIEQKILDIQIQSNRLALEKEKIEQAVSKLKLAAEVKTQEAETEKTLLDPTKTKEEKQASLATLDAKRFELTAKQMEDVLIADKEKMLGFDEQVERYKLNVTQQTDLQNKEADFAKSQFGSAGKQAILNAIERNLQTNEEYNWGFDINTARYGKEFSVPVAPNFKVPQLGSNDIMQKILDQTNNFQMPFNSDLLSQQTQIQTPTLGFNTVSPTQARQIKNTNHEQKSKQPTQIIVHFDNKNEITVNGTDGTKDFGKKLMDASVMTTQTLYDLIRRTNIELGNE